MLAMPVRLPEAISSASRATSTGKVLRARGVAPTAGRSPRPDGVDALAAEHQVHAPRACRPRRAAVACRRILACSRSAPPEVRTGCARRRRPGDRRASARTRRRARSRRPRRSRARSTSAIAVMVRCPAWMNSCASTTSRPRISSRSAPALKARSPLPRITMHPTDGVALRAPRSSRGAGAAPRS